MTPPQGAASVGGRVNEPDIAPLARRLAEENNVDWRRLPGSGDGGRVVERDVLTFLARVMAGEEDLDPTPEPVPDGMAAWPADDVAAYRAGPAGGSTERSTTATMDDDDLFLFDDDPVTSEASEPASSGRAGDDPLAVDRFAATGSSDDDGVLLVDEEPLEDDPPESVSADADAFSFDDEPRAMRPQATVPDDAVLPDVFADDGASPVERDDEVLFLDEPMDVDAAAPTAEPEPAAAAPEPWAAWDGESDVTFGEDAATDERRAVLDGDETPTETASAAGETADDVWRRRDGPSVPAEPSHGSSKGMPDLPRPTGNGDAKPAGVEATFGGHDQPAREDATRSNVRSAPETSSVGALSAGGVSLVRHGQLWRRRFDDRAFRTTVSQVADALEAPPASVAEVLLARAVAAAWQVDDVDAWRWLPSGARRHAVEIRGSLRDAVAAAGTAPHLPSDRRVSLAVADLATIDLDEAVVHLDVPLLAIGRATVDGAWLTLSGDEVPAEAVAALATVAESLKSPVRLLL
jgi:hypothetical protein